MKKIVSFTISPGLLSVVIGKAKADKKPVSRYICDCLANRNKLEDRFVRAIYCKGKKDGCLTILSRWKIAHYAHLTYAEILDTFISLREKEFVKEIKRGKRIYYAIHS